MLDSFDSFAFPLFQFANPKYHKPNQTAVNAINIESRYISTRLVAYKNAISPPTSPKGYLLEKWEGGGPFPPTNCQEKCPRNKVDVTCHLSTLIMVYCTYQESSRIWYSNSPENSSVLTWSCKRSGLTRFHSDHDFPRRSTKES